MFISVPEALLYANAFGPRNARAILAIGGWTGSWELWTDTFALLSDSYRTIAFDHRGTGATTCRIESITYENLVRDVFAVMDAFGIEQCVLAGESAGAAVAMGAALAQPERFSALVLVGALYVSEPLDGPDMFRMGLEKAYAQTVDRFVQLCLPEPDSAHFARWGNMILNRASQPAAIALLDINRALDLRARVSEIQQPTLLLHGAQDAIVPFARAEWLAQNMPHAQLHSLPDTGHVPTITRPAHVANAIREFLDKQHT